MRSLEFIEEIGEDFGRWGWRWAGGVIASDGCIYTIPYNASRVIRFDPSDNSSRLIGDDLGYAKGKWRQVFFLAGTLIFLITLHSHEESHTHYVSFYYRTLILQHFEIVIEVIIMLPA